MTYVTIVRCETTELTDDCHAVEAEAVAHATRLAARLDERFSVAVIACSRVTNYQFGSAIFYQPGAGADLY